MYINILSKYTVYTHNTYIFMFVCLIQNPNNVFRLQLVCFVLKSLYYMVSPLFFWFVFPEDLGSFIL